MFSAKNWFDSYAAQLRSLTLGSLIRVVFRHSGFGLRPRLSGTIPTRLTTSKWLIPNDRNLDPHTGDRTARCSAHHRIFYWFRRAGR
jgi:hypothetical protein